MPSHPIHAALLQMFLDANGAPWTFVKWQNITGVRHGLFPDDPELLPEGWSAETALWIRSYFDQYSKKSTEDDKLKFASARARGTPVPGRDAWRKWVTECWKTWKVHSIVVEVLSQENLHPLTLAYASSPDTLEWPNANQWLLMAVDPVGVALFGEEVLDRNGRVQSKLRDTTLSLIQCTWKNLYNQTTRSKTRIIALEKEAIEAFNQLDREKPTKKNLRSVIIKLARWRNLAEVLKSNENAQKQEEMEAELERLMLGIGAEIKGANTGAKLKQPICKVNSDMLKSLASEGDVADVIALYADFFCSPGTDDSVPLQDQHATLGVPFSRSQNDTDDCGVDVEAVMGPEILASQLGFIDGLPLLFNAYRHLGGLNPWNADSRLFDPEKAKDNDEMEPIMLHWHQLAGVHAIMRMLFTEKPSPNKCHGVLIADEVGLGKTFQAATAIAFLSDLRLRQRFAAANHVSLPPIIRRTPYLGETTELPEFPHLVVVPGTLLSQWESELRTLFKPKSFDILTYGSGKGRREIFWSENGPFRTSRHSLSQIIIVATHSALQQDFSLLYAAPMPRVGSTALPWEAPIRLPGHQQAIKNTLFGQFYLSITLDEAHGYRNAGSKHLSAFMLLQQATVRLIMTATPLQTSTKDVAGMGRLIGVPYFVTEEALAEEKADMAKIRRIRASYQGTDEAEVAVKECQVAIAHRMHNQFGDRILRRTITSLTWDGKALVTLPPCKTITAYLVPTGREKEIIGEIADRFTESVAASNGVLMVVSRSFYIEHRMCVGYARYNLDEEIPYFNTLQEWQAKKSTKFDTCAHMCLHLLSHDLAPEVEFKNGFPVFHPVPEVPSGEKAPKTTKILIYQEFPSLGPLLRNVLDLYEIQYLYIDGQTPFVMRAKIVKDFNTNPDLRVLIISPAGSTGLNLSVASILICIVSTLSYYGVRRAKGAQDQPWSAQDERQIRGRIYRQPQRKAVTCYHLLADETADLILSDLARGKQDMMEAFLQKDYGRDMYDLLTGKTLPSPGDDEHDAETEKRALGEEEKPRRRDGRKKTDKKDENIKTKEKKAEMKARAKQAKEEEAAKRKGAQISAQTGSNFTSAGTKADNASSGADVPSAPQIAEGVESPTVDKASAGCDSPGKARFDKSSEDDGMDVDFDDGGPNPSASEAGDTTDASTSRMSFSTGDDDPGYRTPPPTQQAGVRRGRGYDHQSPEVREDIKRARTSMAPRLSHPRRPITPINYPSSEEEQGGASGEHKLQEINPATYALAIKSLPVGKTGETNTQGAETHETRRLPVQGPTKLLIGQRNKPSLPPPSRGDPAFSSVQKPVLPPPNEREDRMSRPKGLFAPHAGASSKSKEGLSGPRLQAGKAAREGPFQETEPSLDGSKRGALRTEEGWSAQPRHSEFLNRLTHSVDAGGLAKRGAPKPALSGNQAKAPRASQHLSRAVSAQGSSQQSSGTRDSARDLERANDDLSPPPKARVGENPFLKNKRRV